MRTCSFPSKKGTLDCHGRNRVVFYYLKNNSIWQDMVECPVCKGKLHLSHAAVNGHVWGKCETAGCVEWME